MKFRSASISTLLGKKSRPFPDWENPHHRAMLARATACLALMRHVRPWRKEWDEVEDLVVFGAESNWFLGLKGPIYRDPITNLTYVGNKKDGSIDWTFAQVNKLGSTDPVIGVSAAWDKRASIGARNHWTQAKNILEIDGNGGVAPRPELEQLARDLPLFRAIAKEAQRSLDALPKSWAEAQNRTYADIAKLKESK